MYLPAVAGGHPWWYPPQWHPPRVEMQRGFCIRFPVHREHVERQGLYHHEQDIAFLQESRYIRAECDGPWMLCGDFNLIYRDEDKNNGNLDRHMMGRFQRLLNDLALKEIYLNRWRCTWSTEQSPPKPLSTWIASSAQLTGKSNTVTATLTIAHCFWIALQLPQTYVDFPLRISGHVWTVSRTLSRRHGTLWTAPIRSSA